MIPNMGAHIGIGAATLTVVTGMVSAWVSGANNRLEESLANPGSKPEVAVAAAADESYCTSELKPILRRVLTSCGLINSSGGRGCQPLEARQVAEMAGEDFNALFLPLANRAAILQFDKDSSSLDEKSIELLSATYADRRGASYFFVVSRSSPEGSVKHNQELSEARGNEVLNHLRTIFDDPDMEKEVGLLQLGEEFAQLDTSFCQWSRSRPDETCDADTLNRSAFIAWIDCRL